MIALPDRIGALITRIEAGETVTQEDVDRIARLQALDLARAGREFVTAWAAREEAETERFRQMVEAA